MFIGALICIQKIAVSIFVRGVKCVIGVLRACGITIERDRYALLRAEQGDYLFPYKGSLFRDDFCLENIRRSDVVFEISNAHELFPLRRV